MKKNLLIAFCALFSATSLLAQNGTIVWGGPGDPNSEFAGGLNDWTVNAISDEDALWIWEEDGAADRGNFSGPGAVINSPSIDNGAMVFDGDFYNTDGMDDNFGNGIAPSEPNSELISPIMDLSDVTTGISLRFNQSFRHFANTPAVSWSNDGGETWTDPQFINQDIAVNDATATTDVQNVPLFGAETSDQFRVKFIYLGVNGGDNGNFYYWIIDDVQIVTREFNDLQVNDNFFAIAPSYQTPASQVDNFGFLVDITNNGGIDQPNVVVNMTITDEDGNEIYSEDNNYGTVGDSLVENSSFGGFTPPAEPGTYTGTYSISSDSMDIDPSNDELSFEFEVTEEVFAKEDGVTRTIFPAADNWGDGDPHQWAYGNHYYMPNGDGFIAESATFSIDGTSEVAGTILNVSLYKWVDANEDGNLDVDERDAGLVGFTLYEVLGTESENSLITVPLIPTSGNPTGVLLEDNTSYVIMLEYSAETAEQDLAFGASDEFDYGAMVLNSEQQGAPRYSALLGIAGNLSSEAYSSVGFGRDFVPVVRLTVVEEPSNINVPTLAQNTLLINPNPASEVLNAQLNFVDNTEKVTLRLLDVQGRVIATRVIENVQTANVAMDIDNLPAGSYFLNVTTAAGQLTKNVVVK